MPPAMAPLPREPTLAVDGFELTEIKPQPRRAAVADTAADKKFLSKIWEIVLNQTMDEEMRRMDIKRAIAYFTRRTNTELTDAYDYQVDAAIQLIDNNNPEVALKKAVMEWYKARP
jgi:hypothetical protein